VAVPQGFTVIVSRGGGTPMDPSYPMPMEMAGPHYLCGHKYGDLKTQVRDGVRG